MLDNTHAPFDSLVAGSMKPNVVSVAHEVNDAAERFFGKGVRPITVMFGFNPDSKPEHSAGTAIDIMVYNDWTLGDWVSEYLWTNRSRLGVRWEIWRQRIRSTSPGRSGLWTDMADRGNGTLNHKDHIHINFWEQTYRAPGGSPAYSSIPNLPANAPSGPLAPVPHQPDPSNTPQEEALMARIINVLGPDNKSTIDDKKVLQTSSGLYPILNGEELGACRRFVALQNAAASAGDLEINARERDLIRAVFKR